MSAPPLGPLLVLVGPTAAGKSAAALALAQQLGGEIVSADAMAVYRGMDIGTAKPSRAERALVPHHLVDVIDPEEELSASVFQQLARDAIAAIQGRGHLPIVVGGSGLYVHAVIDDFQFPPTDLAVRQRLQQRAATEGTPAMFEELRQADPVAATRMQPANLRRIVRALEVIAITGRPFSSFRSAMDAPPLREGHRILGFAPDRELLRMRIAERVARMVTAGLLDEVRGLAARPLSRTARQALGYKQLLPLFDPTLTHPSHVNADGREVDRSESRESIAGPGDDQGGVPEHAVTHPSGGTDHRLDEALERVVHDTRAYARRQLAWYRRDSRIAWTTAPDAAAQLAWVQQHWNHP